MKRTILFGVIVAAAAGMGAYLGTQHRKAVLEHHAARLATPADPDQPLILSDIDLDAALQGLQEVPRGQPRPNASPSKPAAASDPEQQSARSGMVIWRLLIDANTPAGHPQLVPRRATLPSDVTSPP